jgi:alkaline phosphatase D
MKRRTWLTWAGASALAGCASAPAPSAVRLRIGVSSCADQTRPQPVWDAVLADRPDFFIFGGDNVYASDEPFKVESLRTAYETAAAIENFARLRASVPHLAVWDDHDYGVNNGGADFPHKQASKDEFMRFWRLPADDPRRTRDGLYHAQLIEKDGKRVQVIGLDLRWFRSAWKVTDVRAPGKERYLPDTDPAKTMLGETQWRWLEAQLRVPADVRLLMSSSQCIVEGHGWERWGNFPLERERLYRLVRSTDARGVIVLSGDRHIGAIYREANALLPYPLYELTSSGVTHPWGKGTEVGPNRITELVTVVHYGRVDVDFGARTVTLGLYDVNGHMVCQHTVSFAEIQVA